MDMRPSHAADANLAPTNPPTLCCGTDPQHRVPGSFEDFGATAPKSVQLAGQPKRSLCGACQVGVCADTWVTPSSCERRRSRAMPMLSMKTKKPMLKILAITDDAGLSSPNQPASAPTSSPSHPIQRGSARVVRMATAYSGTTHADAEEVAGSVGHKGDSGEGVGSGSQRGLFSRVCVEVGRHQFVAHRDGDQVRNSHQR
jgi:hypothetical protein